MTNPRNRVVQLRRFGGAHELEVVEAPMPTAGRGEVRVRVLASSLEYTDVVIRRHMYPQTLRRKPPFVLGLSPGSVTRVTRSSTTFIPSLLPPPGFEKNERPSSAGRAAIEPTIN